MKTNVYFLVLFLATVFVASSCKKDDEKPNFRQEDLYGTWKSTTADEDDCYEVLVIDEETIGTGYDCGDGTDEGYGMEYTYANNTLTVEESGGEITYQVLSLSSTKMKLKQSYSFMGQNLGSETFEYVKQ